MRLDLHVHSSASDGTCTPEEVVERAVAGGIDVLALSDHDTVAGVEPALRAAAARRLHVIPAAELSASVRGQDVHILGYFIDPQAPAIQAFERRCRERRRARMERMLSLLARQGVVLNMDALGDQVLSAHTTITRAHLGRALVTAGHASSTYEAFTKLIGNHCPAYEPAAATTAEEVFDVIAAAGGIAVWAHPPPGTYRELLPCLIGLGLRGLEVFRSPGRSASVLELEHSARAANLLVTGGSDWHGSEGGRELGDFFVTGDEVAEFLAAGGL